MMALSTLLHTHTRPYEHGLLVKKPVCTTHVTSQWEVEIKTNTVAVRTHAPPAAEDQTSPALLNHPLATGAQHILKYSLLTAALHHSASIGEPGAMCILSTSCDLCVAPRLFTARLQTVTVYM